MKKLIYSSRYKKDFKRYRNQPYKLKALIGVLRLLEEGSPIPLTMHPRMLTGDYAGCMECHIGNDFLLIWIDETADVVRLLRLGTHSELF